MLSFLTDDNCGGLNLAASILSFMTFQLCIPFLLICLVVIKVKSSKDILQGVSKLDYLLVVSVFQIQKEPEGSRQTSFQTEDRSSGRVINGPSLRSMDSYLINQ